jgi:hypothetical protein
MLHACSKPVDLVARDESVGPITTETPFDVGAISKLLPTRTVEAGISSALQPGEDIIRVSDGDRPLMELYPSQDRLHVETALIVDASIADGKGIHIGSTFAEAIPDGDTRFCNVGKGPKDGRVYCPQPASVHIIYEFQGATPVENGLMPGAVLLADWKVTAMLWDGSDPAP